ncbi:hypothetical protein B0T26DRAFT_707486, partial [Lasiosphaeria miniovina]
RPSHTNAPTPRASQISRTGKASTSMPIRPDTFPLAAGAASCSREPTPSAATSPLHQSSASFAPTTAVTKPSAGSTTSASICPCFTNSTRRPSTRTSRLAQRRKHGPETTHQTDPHHWHGVEGCGIPHFLMHLPDYLVHVLCKPYASWIS